MLLTVFSPIQKRLRKLLKYQEIKTDNLLFRLHCIATVAVLIGASALLTTHQLVGTPMLCLTSLSEKLKDWNKPITTFCWVTTTFTMPVEINEIHNSNSNPPRNSFDVQINSFSKRNRVVGKDMAHPGVYNPYDSNGHKRYYTYYQWVCFVLFLQGLLCSIPKIMWSKFEGGLVTKLATGLQCICQKDDLEKRTDAIITYLQRYRKTHTKYAMFYWFCEGLCLLNLLLQMWLMNIFLGGYFFSSGWEALRNTDTPQYERNDPLIYVFPRVTKCEFYYSGPTGGLVNLDNLCVLPQNIINEKVFIMLWFWYIILSAMFIFALIYRITIILKPSFRCRLLMARSRCIPLDDAKKVTSNLDIGDWWLMYTLAKNLDPLVFRDLISEFIIREKKRSASI